MSYKKLNVATWKIARLLQIWEHGRKEKFATSPLPRLHVNGKNKEGLIKYMFANVSTYLLL